MTRSTRNRLFVGSLSGLLLAAGVALVAARQLTVSEPPRASPPVVLTFADVLAMAPEQVGQHDIARLNLACSSGLKGTESLDGAASLALLDTWAREAGKSTEQNLWRYHANPGLWKQSENWFRVSCMVRCLRVHAGTQYVPALRTHPPSRDMWDLKFYRDAHSIFLFGLLTGLRQGTCTSLPVLTVAVGRRLGYPLKLVKSAGHLFVRWDDGSGKEVFNIESTDAFAEIKSDDFYRSFPLPMNPADEASGRMMVSMTPVQELALFCFLRGHNLWQNGDLAGARQAYLKGHMLDPYSRQDEYAYRVQLVDRMAREEAYIRKNMPWLPRGFCLNDPVNNIDPLGEAGYFFDGTWVNKDDPKNPVETNVGRLHKSYRKRAWYREGVGSTGRFWSRLWGGVFGSGWESRLEWMYKRLVETYNDDSDPENKQIDIFGFSRGAGMARDFANMIHERGVPYKGRKVIPTIRFLGVYDTVASRGIPGNDINIGANLSLAPNVLCARHAMSRHEVRGAFPLTRFKPDPRVREQWFAGVHSDGGGAYPDRPEQGYVALYWMLMEAWDAGVPLGGLGDEKYRAIMHYRFKHDLDWDELWSENRDDIKVNPYHDSADSILYTKDRIKRYIRTVTGGDRYERTIYEH